MYKSQWSNFSAFNLIYCLSEHIPSEITVLVTIFRSSSLEQDFLFCTLWSYLNLKNDKAEYAYMCGSPVIDKLLLYGCVVYVASQWDTPNGFFFTSFSKERTVDYFPNLLLFQYESQFIPKLIMGGSGTSVRCLLDSWTHTVKSSFKAVAQN